MKEVLKIVEFVYVVYTCTLSPWHQDFPFAFTLFFNKKSRLTMSKPSEKKVFKKDQTYTLTFEIDGEYYPTQAIFTGKSTENKSHADFVKASDPTVTYFLSYERACKLAQKVVPNTDTPVWQGQES